MIPPTNTKLKSPREKQNMVAALSFAKKGTKKALSKRFFVPFQTTNHFSFS
jgi:hypothetical protein